MLATTGNEEEHTSDVLMKYVCPEPSLVATNSNK